MVQKGPASTLVRSTTFTPSRGLGGVVGVLELVGGPVQRLLLATNTALALMVVEEASKSQCLVPHEE